MSRALRALTWEQWRVTRWPLLAILICTLQIDLVMWIQWKVDWVRANDAADLADRVLILPVIATLLVLLAGHFDRENLTLGYPIRMFRLPISSRILATHTYVTRMIEAFSVFALMLIIHVCLFSGDTAWSLGFGVLGLVATAALVQGVAGVHGGAALVSLAVGAATWTTLVARKAETVSLPTVLMLAFAVGALGAGYAGSVWGTAWNRHARRGWDNWVHRLREWMQVWEACALTPRAKTLRRFRSVTAAQAWYEWRTGGRAVLVLLAVWLLAVAIGFSQSGDVRDWAEWVFPMASGVAFLVGQYQAYRDYRTSREGSMRFVAVRPLTNGQFASAKMRMVFKTALLLFGAAIVLRYLLAFLESGLIAKLLSNTLASAPAFTVSILVIRGAFWFAVIWAALWLVNRYTLAVALIVGVPTYLYAMFFHGNDFETVAVHAVSILVTASVACAFSSAYHARILSLLAVLLAIIAWLMLTAFLVQSVSFYAEQDTWEFVWKGRLMLELAGMISALVLSPFATVPLAVTRRRAA